MGEGVPTLDGGGAPTLYGGGGTYLECGRGTYLQRGRGYLSWTGYPLGDITYEPACEILSLFNFLWLTKGKIHALICVLRSLYLCTITRQPSDTPLNRMGCEVNITAYVVNFILVRLLTAVLCCKGKDAT